MAEGPFAVLGIAPTLDLGAVKRAYFAALPRHPPHADPAGMPINPPLGTVGGATPFNLSLIHISEPTRPY